MDADAMVTITLTCQVETTVAGLRLIRHSLNIRGAESEEERQRILDHLPTVLSQANQCFDGNQLEDGAKVSIASQTDQRRREGVCRKFRFTHAALLALPPHPEEFRSGQTEYRDTEVLGLCLSVGRTGRKHFYFRFRFRGRKRCLVLGDFPSVSIKEARERAHEARGCVARSIDPTTERKKRDSIPTLAEFSVQFLQWSRQHKRSWRDDESRFKVELLPRFGNRVLDAISPRDILAMHAEVQARSSNSNANRYLALIKRIYTLAAEWEVLEHDPARVIKKVQENRPRERVLTAEEIPRFLRALDTLENRSIAEGLRLLVYSGLRKSEVFNLEWRHVRRENRTIYLAQTKSGKPRLVFLNSLAQQVIDTRWADKKTNDLHVFPGRRSGQHVVEVRVSFKEACAKAKICGVCVHTLRHTFASVCVSSGVPLYDVQKLLGHTSSQTTQRYAHLEDACQRQATEQFASRITDLLSKPEAASIQAIDSA